jgi:hypothetical protein
MIILSDFSRQPQAAQLLFVAYAVCDSLYMVGFLLWSFKGKYRVSYSVLKGDLHVQIHNNFIPQYVSHRHVHALTTSLYLSTQNTHCRLNKRREEEAKGVAGAGRGDSKSREGSERHYIYYVGVERRNKEQIYCCKSS